MRFIVFFFRSIGKIPKRIIKKIVKSNNLILVFHFSAFLCLGYLLVSSSSADENTAGEEQSKFRFEDIDTFQEGKTFLDEIKNKIQLEINTFDTLMRNIKREKEVGIPYSLENVTLTTYKANLPILSCMYFYPALNSTGELFSTEASPQRGSGTIGYDLLNEILTKTLLDPIIGIYGRIKVVSIVHKRDNKFKFTLEWDRKPMIEKRVVYQIAWIDEDGDPEPVNYRFRYHPIRNKSKRKEGVYQFRMLRFKKNKHEDLASLLDPKSSNGVLSIDKTYILQMIYTLEYAIENKDTLH